MIYRDADAVKLNIKCLVSPLDCMFEPFVISLYAYGHLSCHPSPPNCYSSRHGVAMQGAH